MFHRTLAAAILLAAVSPLACAQGTFSFNPDYPLNPDDPEPRTLRWSDARNWAGNLPGSLDHINLGQYSELTTAFTVGSAHISSAMIAGEGGSLEVLGEFNATGEVTFFNALTLRGPSTFGAPDDNVTHAVFYQNVDNYGDLLIASSHYAPLSFTAGASHPVFTNHAGATLTIGDTTLAGSFSRFVNAAGATLTKTGTTDGAINFSDGDSRTFENHGTLSVEGGTLLLSGSGDWDGGTLSVANGAKVLFNFALPTGTVNVNGAGTLSALGYGNTGDLTLNFAAESEISLVSFKPYEIHNLTVAGPVRLVDIDLRGDGTLTLQGAPTLDLTGLGSGGSQTSIFYTNVRNEGVLTLLGRTTSSYLSNDSAYRFVNATGATLALKDVLNLVGGGTLENHGVVTVDSVHDHTARRIEWQMENSGSIAIDKSTLDLRNTSTWSPTSTVALTDGGRLRFLVYGPSGQIAATGNGSIELTTGSPAAALTFQNDFALSIASGVDVRANALQLDGAALTVSGPGRFWSYILNSTDAPGSLLTLKDGVRLDPLVSPIVPTGDLDYTYFNADVAITTSGNVYLVGSAKAAIVYQGFIHAFTNNGTLIKTGAENFDISTAFVNRGHVEVEEGRLALYGYGDWAGHTANVQSGATLQLHGAIPQNSSISGTGNVELIGGLSFLTVEGAFRLPFAAGSQLTLLNSRLTGDDVLTVDRDVTFVGNVLNFAGGLNLTAPTHWGPRSGLADSANLLGGAVANHAAATVRGALDSGAFAFDAQLSALTWENHTGSSLNLLGDGVAPAHLSNADAGHRSTLNNRAGATVIAGFGGAVVDWAFNNQGTVRIINGETLTTTAGGNWQGGAVEQFQSYLNFRGELPSGDFSVTGVGDVSFGAKTLGTSGDYDRTAVAVPLAGTTIRFIADSQGTAGDHGLYGDLTGPGRLTIYGDHLGLEPTYNAPRGGFVPANYTSWSNEGGVALYGNLTVGSGGALTVDSAAGLDIYGRLTVNNSLLVGAEIDADKSSVAHLRVQSGGTLAMNGDASIIGFRSSPRATHFAALAGSQVSFTNGSSYAYGVFENHGTLTLTNSTLTLETTGDWTGGRVHLDFPSDVTRNKIQFTTTAPSYTGADSGAPAFRGWGVVEFGAQAGTPVAIDNRRYSFEPLFNRQPDVLFTGAGFTEANSALILTGAARLLDSLALSVSPAAAAGTTPNTLALQGDFTLNTALPSYFISVPRIENYGSVAVGTPLLRSTGGGAGIGVAGPGESAGNLAVLGSDRGITFQNTSAATFTLHNGADLLIAPAGNGVNPHFINELGATFASTGVVSSPSVVAWDFTNNGLIDVQSGKLSFTGFFANNATGSFHVATGAEIDFGANSTVNLNAPFTANGGTITASQFVVSSSVTPSVSGLVRLQGGSVTFSNNSTLNVGSSTIEFAAPVNGSGTVHAGSVVFGSSAPLVSTTPGTFVVEGNLQVTGGTSVNFGSGSVVRLVDGHFTGDGSVQAGEVVVVGNGSTVTTSGGMLTLTSGSLTLQSGATANFGTSTVTLAAPINGSGTVVAGNLVFNGGGSFVSDTPGTVNLSSNVTFTDGTLVNFGSGTVVVHEGHLAGTGELRAGQVVFSGTDTPLFSGGGTFIVRSGDVILQNSAVASFGTSNVQLVAPVSGTGSVFAGSVTWTEGTFVSTGTSTLTFESGVFVRSGAVVNFGGDSTITVDGTLGGTGTVEAGTLFVSGNVTPGSSPGTLALVGDTTFANDTVFNFELGLAAKDLITVDDNLALAGTVNLTPLFDLTSGSYLLFTHTGTLTDNGLTLGATPGGYSAALFFDTLNHAVGVSLTATAVPEPATFAFAAGALGLAAALWRRRRRAQSSTSHSSTSNS